MDRVYEVRYKGRLEHQNLDEHALVELVRSGEISGVHAYRGGGVQRWLPVFRMEFVRKPDGLWTIVDEAQPAKPVPQAAAQTTPLPAPAVAASPLGPHTTNPSVIIMTGSAQPVRGDAIDSAVATSLAGGGGLSISGFVVGLSAAVTCVALLAPPLVRLETTILGALLGIVAIILSACGLPYQRRRGLAIAGMVVGIVALLVGVAVLASLVWRGIGR